jgi:ferredoxin-NADP reductase
VAGFISIGDTIAKGKAMADQLMSVHLPSPQGPIYYLPGPPAMVAAMRRTLIEAGVDEDDIRTEEFSGY